jgi:hypothetical protein
MKSAKGKEKPVLLLFGSSSSTELRATIPQSVSSHDDEHAHEFAWVLVV